MLEGYGRNLVERLLLVDQVQLHVDSTGADLTAVATVGDILGKEYRIGVAWTERLELLQETEEFRGDLAELQLGVDVGHRGQHLLGDLSGDELVYPADELLQVALFESQAGRIDVPAEVLKKRQRSSRWPRRDRNQPHCGRIQ